MPEQTQAIIPSPTAGAVDAMRPDLRERVGRFVNASKAANTRRTYASAWASFAAFCARHGYQPLPASPEAVIDFITDLADAGAKAATIQVGLAAIGFAHDSAEATNPAKSPKVRATAAGIRRTIGTAQQRKAPVTLADLKAVIAGLPDDLRGKRDKAILLIGWAGAFRRSELVGLEVGDVRFDAAKATITLRRSKTDQEGQGIVKVIPAMDDKSLCPVQALRDWLDAAEIQSGVIFRSIDRWGRVHGAMDGREIARIVKRAVERAGMDSRQFGGHSLRAGFVTQAATVGVPEWQIQETTGHRSTQVLRRYIRDAGAGQVDAIRRAFGQV